MAWTRSFVANTFQHSMCPTQIINDATRITETMKRTSLVLFNSCQCCAINLIRLFLTKLQHSLQLREILCRIYYSNVAAPTSGRCAWCPSRCHRVAKARSTIRLESPFHIISWPGSSFLFRLSDVCVFVRSTYYTGLDTKRRYGFSCSVRCTRTWVPYLHLSDGMVVSSQAVS